MRNSGARTSEIEIAHGRRRGVGLANLEARLQLHFGSAAHLTLIPAASETIAVVSMPLAHRVLARGA